MPRWERNSAGVWREVPNEVPVGSPAMWPSLSSPQGERTIASIWSQSGRPRPGMQTPPRTRPSGMANPPATEPSSPPSPPPAPRASRAQRRDIDIFELPRENLHPPSLGLHLSPGPTAGARTWGGLRAGTNSVEGVDQRNIVVLQGPNGHIGVEPPPSYDPQHLRGFANDFLSPTHVMSDGRGLHIPMLAPRQSVLRTYFTRRWRERVISPRPARTNGNEGAEDRVNPEEVDGPRPMASNHARGPRTTDGSYLDEMRQAEADGDLDRRRELIEELAELDERLHAPQLAASGYPGPFVRALQQIQDTGIQGIRQPVFPERRVSDPVVQPVSTTHKLVCDWIDFHEKKDIPESLKAPSEFLCPLSLHSMRDPVNCDDGHVYERAHIEAWCNSPTSNGLSPLTRAPMSENRFSCMPLVSMMEAWVRTKITVHEGWSLEQAIRAHFGEDVGTETEEGAAVVEAPPEKEPPAQDNGRMAHHVLNVYGIELNVEHVD